MAALALTVAISGAGTAVVAQDGQGGGGQGGGQGRGDGQQRERGAERQRMDPEQMRQRMAEALKERLGATDEEWQALEPKIEAVLRAQQNARAGGMGFGPMGGRGGRGGMGGPGGGGPGGGGPGGPGGPDQPESQSEIAKAARELRTVLDDENAPAEQLAQRLDAFRVARKAAEAELDAARGELQGLLTQRQEAMLVMMGMLE